MLQQLLAFSEAAEIWPGALAAFGPGAASVFGFLLDRSASSSRVLFSRLSSAALRSASLNCKLSLSLLQLLWTWIDQRNASADMVGSVTGLSWWSCGLWCTTLIDLRPVSLPAQVPLGLDWSARRLNGRRQQLEAL